MAQILHCDTGIAEAFVTFAKNWGVFMDRQKIIADILPVFISILKKPRLRLTETTCAHDIDEWDSLNHILLIHSIEKLYNIRFTIPEIQSPRVVSNLVTLIQEKLTV